MKIKRLKSTLRIRRAEQGVTLAEVLVAFLISGLSVLGLVKGYIVANQSSQKFAMSLAASAQASEWIERMRSAEWDTSSFPVVDQLTSSNFSSEVVPLEFAGSGTNVTYATNYATISTISSNPPLRRIHVDCVWIFQGTQILTNSIETERAPNQ